MSSKSLRIGMIAGEMSGDLLGAELIKSIRKNTDDVIFEGIGGPKMIAEGFISHIDQERLAVMGLVEILGRLPELLSIRKRIRKIFLDNPPDVFIGIDSPDFNLPVERTLKKSGIRTVHYVSPSVWAWRQKRVKKIAQSVDLMLALLPFEAEFYRQHQVPVEFVGHPLADQIPIEPDQAAAKQKLGTTDQETVIALLPGSRGSEVDMLCRDFLQAAELCVQRCGIRHFKFIIPAANEKRFKQIQTILNAFSSLNVKLVLGQSHDVMAAADVVLMASGTTTLEALLLKRPMVVAYRFAPITYAIVSRLLTIPFVALPNILASKQLVPEILQNEVSPSALSDGILDYFKNPEKVTQLQNEFCRIHQQLRCNASDVAARAVLTLARERIVEDELEKAAP